MEIPQQQRIRELWRMVGDTPLIELRYRLSGREGRVLVKCEHYNLTGSIKDRMALYILEQAYASGLLSGGELIAEATSGNTGIAFAAIGRALGHPVRIFMPDWMSRERKDIIKSYGAEVIPVSKAEGGFLGSIRMAEELGKQPGVFLPRQFENRFNVEAHEKTTGREIGHLTLLRDIRPAAFVAGVGTGGTVMGVGNYLRRLYPDIRVHPLEPLESPTLSTGHKIGSHRIQGISDEFIPEIVRLKELDRIIQVSDGDAILMAQALGRNLGLAVGISSGANLLGAIKVQQELKTDSPVITVFADSNKKYLTTDLVREEPLRANYLSPQVELLGFTPLEKADMKN